MSEAATRMSVNALYKAYGEGDVDRVAALIHTDIDWIIHGPVQVFPFQGPRRGRAAVLEVLGAIGKNYALESHTPEIVIVEGDRAAVLANVAFVQRATNRILRMRLVNFLRFQDGQLIEFREFSDTFDAVEQALGTWLKVPPAA
jgi:ketosteroid isomerase-like protein